MWRFRVAFAVALALLPSWLKVPLYRWLYGYQIGRGVRIGLSPFIGVTDCVIGDQVTIGSFNLFLQIETLEIGAHTQIGFGNILRGGVRVRLGPYVSILRMNVLNAIVQGDFVEPVEPILDLGTGAVVTSGHWLDFSGQITIGDHTIIGGRNSSLWTHNRQRTRPITVGNRCYVGSEVRFAPGTEVASLCIVALGSVLAGRLQAPRSLIGGNPAVVVRPLREKDYDLVCHKNRQDIPDDLVLKELPEELWPYALGQCRNASSPK